MAKYAGIEIETPQEVLARIRKQREAAMGGATSPEEINRIQGDRALDLIFGNQEVTAAEEKTGALTSAMEKAKEGMKDMDLSEDEKQIIRLSHVRDALEETDPAQAMQISDKIRMVKVQQLERRVLQNKVAVSDSQVGELNKRYAFNPDTLQTEEFDLTSPDGFAKVQEARDAGKLVTKTEGELVNIFNAERGRQFTAEQSRLDAQAKLEEARLEADGSTHITKTRRTALQGSIEANSQLMTGYRRAAALLTDPEMLRMSSRMKNFATSIADFAGIPGVSTAQVEKYRRFQSAISQAQGAANRLIKERSGAAVTEQEWERLKEELPVAGDGPIKFMEKMNNLNATLQQSNRRATQAMMENDFRVLGYAGEDFAKDEDILFSDNMFKSTFGKTPSKPKAPTAAQPAYKPGDWRQFTTGVK